MRATVAHGSWSASPVTIRESDLSLTIVEGCSDGSTGTFVAWQEETVGGDGTVRVQHLLENGDLDAACPADGAIVNPVVAHHSMLGILPDHLGGLYLWRKVEPDLYLTRLDANGHIASGWPAEGIRLGRTYVASPRPSVEEDGESGIYVVWANDTPGNVDRSTVVLARYGPDGGPGGGWIDPIRIVVPATLTRTDEYWPQIATSAGAVYVAWASSPGSRRLLRLSHEGLPDPGWPEGGVDFGPFVRPWPATWDPMPALLGLGGDGRGGAFVYLGNLDASGFLTTRLYRWGKDGERARDWPAQGTGPPWWPNLNYLQFAPPLDFSLRVIPDGHDGAFVGAPIYFPDSSPLITYSTCSPQGVVPASPTWMSSAIGHEFLVGTTGVARMASLEQVSYCGQFPTSAFIDLSPGFHESHSEPCIMLWFWDVGLAPTATGGMVFIWSQSYERHGVFARRFESGGEVTGVDTRLVSIPGIRALHFVAGVGVRASVNFDSGGLARLELFDIAGRKVAGGEARNGVEVTFPGTSDLASGLYFARATAGTEVFRGKVLVAR